ncbi:MAG: DUF4271 domain-containing protein [Ferruginibacter sp.]|nr:DUF4271 domain-containing protein [Chitinophagaceae bacterium]
MNPFFIFILVTLLFAKTTAAQVPADTTHLPITDTLLPLPVSKDLLPPVQLFDSVSKRPSTDSGWTVAPGISFTSPAFAWEILRRHPWFPFKMKAVQPPPSDLRRVQGKELLFYLLVFLLAVFAFLRMAFPKYFNDLFRLFFRTTLKQRQISEQLMQTPLPSLLLNIFFIVCSGLYITFLLDHFQLNPVNNFWLLFLYCCLGLSAAYFVKFIGLKISGWLFNMTEAADSYIFIVFIVNKMIGILLLPFIVLLAFTAGDVYSVSITLSWCLVAALLFYRFILTYAAVRNQVKVNPFHFFLYLCAFEIAPLLLVYKGLLLFFGITA